MSPSWRSSAARSASTLRASVRTSSRGPCFGPLGDMLGLRVKVAHKGAGGTVTLHYSSLDQLDMICQRLSGEPI